MLRSGHIPGFDAIKQAKSKWDWISIIDAALFAVKLLYLVSLYFSDAIDYHYFVYNTVMINLWRGILYAVKHSYWFS